MSATATETTVVKPESLKSVLNEIVDWLPVHDESVAAGIRAKVDSIDKDVTDALTDLGLAPASAETQNPDVLQTLSTIAAAVQNLSDRVDAVTKPEPTA